MPTFDGVINLFVKGDDLDVIRTVTNIPTGQTVTQAWLTVKAPGGGADPGVFQKDIDTVDDAAQGHISDNGAGDGTAVLKFYLTSTNTKLLTPGTEYDYDIQIKTSANKHYTPEIGKLSCKAEVTLAE